MREQLTHLTKRIRLSVVVIALFMMLLNQSVNIAQTNQAPQLALVPVTEEGVASRVTDLALTADGRFFLVQKDGLVLIAQASGVALEEPFLDISSRVRDSWEQGMLALTFHPDYENNGYFYVSYSSDEFAGATIISRFQVSEDDPNLADAKSEVILLNIPDPHPIHQGGDLAFGPDGYLYISLGDGGPAFDPENRAQDGSVLFGKMLRIDVDNPASEQNYGIPSDNPYVNDSETLDEIWAFGLRNPWRFSFDRLTGDMYIGDVGESTWEEINFEPASSAGGLNYGWSCYEGEEIYEAKHCDKNSTYTAPATKYIHQGASSVTGGFVYRGTQYPELAGWYFFSDFITGKFFALQRDESENWVMSDLLSESEINSATFGEAPNGELYVVNFQSGTIYHLEAQKTSQMSTLYLPFLMK